MKVLQKFGAMLRRPFVSACMAVAGVAISVPAVAQTITYDVYDFSFTTTGTGITEDKLPGGRTSFAGQLYVIGGQVVDIANATYGLLGGQLGVNRYIVTSYDVFSAGGVTSSLTGGLNPTLALTELNWISSIPGQNPGARYSFYNYSSLARGLSYTDSRFAEGDSQTDGLVANSITLAYVGTVSVPEIDGAVLPVAAFVIFVAMVWAGQERRKRDTQPNLMMA